MPLRPLMRADLLTDDDGRVTVRLAVSDEHIKECPTCLALYGLRIASAFVEAIDKLVMEENETGVTHRVH